MNYETSLPHQLQSEISRAPVAYLPWGAHEWHGPHNPVGLDGIKARFFAEELCNEIGGVVFPTVYCGHSTIAELGMPYCLEFGADTISALIRDYLFQLTVMRFRVIVIVLGHWGAQQGGIARYETERLNNVQRLNTVQRSTIAWAVQENELIESLGFPEDHGGAGETSYMMACLPGVVDLSRLPTDREISVEKDGMTGQDPREHASADIGHEAVRAYVREASKRIREILG